MKIASHNPAHGQTYRQTDKQTDRHWRLYSLLDGGVINTVDDLNLAAT